jgi:hypothetical protein
MDVSEEVLKNSSSMERDSASSTDLGIEGAEGAGNPSNQSKAKVGGLLRRRIRYPLKKFYEGSKAARLLQKASRGVLSEEKDPSAVSTAHFPSDVPHTGERASTGNERTTLSEDDGVQHDRKTSVDILDRPCLLRIHMLQRALPGRTWK